MGELLDLSGRVGLVTGGGQGVGRVIALTLARQGAERVVVNDFYEDRALAVAREVERAGGAAMAVRADVTDAAEVRAMFEKVGRVDVLVNNAGNAGPEREHLQFTPFWETGPEEWRRFLGINLEAVLLCCREALPGMIERGFGRLITIVSDAGRVGMPRLEVYAAAKAGAAGFTRALATSVGRHGITANCIALGTMRGPEGGDDADEEVQRRLRGYAIRRRGRPEDAAAMVAFLASDAASWITGQTYPVNGGYSYAM